MQHNASSVSRPPTCATNTSLLLTEAQPSRNYTLSPDKVTNEPACGEPESHRQKHQVFQPRRTVCCESSTPAFSSKTHRTITQFLLSFVQCRPGPGPKSKAATVRKQHIINNPENPFIPATACLFCGLTAQAKRI